MTDVQIGELWEKNYPNRLSDPTARQVCRLICHLIGTVAQNDQSSSTSLQKVRKVLASMNIPEQQYDQVISEN
jgi:hypothetical protein